jgi:antitoxin component of MazEF toxin-antitoxin module
VATQIIAEQTVQTWGNGLGVRLTARIAKAAHLAKGQPVTVEVVEGGVLLRPAGKPRLTLEQKLKLFDPARHGGEVMAAAPVGHEFP